MEELLVMDVMKRENSQSGGMVRGALIKLWHACQRFRLCSSPCELEAAIADDSPGASSWKVVFGVSVP